MVSQTIDFSRDPRTSLMEARKLFVAIADNPTFRDANNILEFTPNGIYSILKRNGYHWEWTLRVTDFILSVWQEDQWYFRVDSKGENSTEDQRIMLKRAQNLLVAMGRHPLKYKIKEEGFKLKRYRAIWGLRKIT